MTTTKRLLMSSLEQFLTDNPTGCLHVHVVSVSLTSVAWLARRTEGRPVVLATRVFQHPYDADLDDWVTVAGFAVRDDVRVVDWSKPSGNGTGTNSEPGESNTPVIFVEDDDGNIAAVLASRDPLPTTTRRSPQPDPTPSPNRPLRRWWYETAAASVAGAVAAAMVVLMAQPVHVPIGAAALILICARVFKPRRSPKPTPRPNPTPLPGRRLPTPRRFDPTRNGSAVTGFVLSLCGWGLVWLPVANALLWASGIVFSSIGAHKTRYGCPHRGLAVAGLAISTVPLLVLSAAVGFFVTRL